MPNSLLFNLLLVLGGASIGGLLARKIKQPIIFGYLLAGLLISAVMAKLGLKRDPLGLLTEIGLVFLMFSLGLEFSFKRFGSLKKVILTGACLQISLTILIGSFLLTRLFGFSLQYGLILSSAFSLSSTAIVVKLLQEKNEFESLSGEIMFGWLLVQDLAVLPLISLLPIFSTGFIAQDIGVSLLTMLKAVLVLAATWFGAEKIVPKLINIIASYKSRELLLLFVVTLIFLFAIIISSVGFSFALGAFLIGLILSQIPAHFAIFSEVRPLRDVFLAIFFVSLGLSLDPNFIVSNLGEIILICAVFLLLKIFLSAGILSFFGYHAKTILRSGFGLAEVGEFSFVYVSSALTVGALNSDGYSLAASVTLLSMVFTPILFWLSDRIYKTSNKLAISFPSIYRRFFVEFDDRLPLDDIPLADHVVVLGYGRVGEWVGNILERVNIPYLVVEYNPQIVRKLKLEGKRVVFGDPSDIDVLEYAQVDKAKMVILAIPDTLTQKIAVTHCRSLNPRMEILCRSHLKEDHRELKSLGVNFIIQPEFEAALSISHRVLQEMGFDKDETGDYLREARKKHEKDVNGQI